MLSDEQMKKLLKFGEIVDYELDKMRRSRMLKADIQAQIEQKTQQLNEVKKGISILSKQLKILRRDEEYLEYEIEELKEELEDE